MVDDFSDRLRFLKSKLFGNILIFILIIIVLFTALYIHQNATVLKSDPCGTCQNLYKMTCISLK